MNHPLSTEPTQTVLVTSRSFGHGSSDVLDPLRRAGLRIHRASPDHTPEELAPVLATAQAWIAGTGPITETHLNAAPHLRIIARYGVGVDNVDRPAANRRGVVITNTPDANTAAVADLTLGLLLAALRTIPAGDRDQRNAHPVARRGRELGTMRLGLVGLGRIGRAVADRARGFGCQLLASDPLAPQTTYHQYGARAVSPELLRAECDAVSLHLPGERRVVDAAWLDTARPGMLLVNTSRAEVVDESAISQALRQGTLAGYATDTLSTEHADGGAPSPLLATDLADRVVLTPHLGAQTVQAVDRMGVGAMNAVLDVLAGRNPQHPVDPP